MKKAYCIIFLFIFVVACGPAKIEQFVNIESNETGFLVPLEGATKGQKKLLSVDYLNSNKIAAKRISLPLREISTGRAWFSYKYIPTMKVIKVNRAPVTREWVQQAEKGTSKADDALYVESRDSISFGVGITCTAMVEEENTALFLYKYANTPLGTIVDSNVRGVVNAALSREYAKYDLKSGRKKKNEIFKLTKAETVQHFKEYGITITSLGLAEGMVYADVAIQEAINAKFTAEMQIGIEKDVNDRQTKINARNVGIAKAEKEAAIQFAKAKIARMAMVKLEIEQMNAKARLISAEKWDGKLPYNILPSDSPLLYNLQSAITGE